MHLPRQAVRYVYGEDSTALSVEQLRGAATSAPLLPPYSLTVLVYQLTF
ncbi:MAG: hypothetical protein IRZ24_00800 [Thermogemmatispora sp.]|nr:hypothetical protein [Thermogemmatispora sp.]